MSDGVGGFVVCGWRGKKEETKKTTQNDDENRDREIERTTKIKGDDEVKRCSKFTKWFSNVSSHYGEKVIFFFEGGITSIDECSMIVVNENSSRVPVMCSDFLGGKLCSLTIAWENRKLFFLLFCVANFVETFHSFVCFSISNYKLWIFYNRIKRIWQWNFPRWLFILFVQRIEWNCWATELFRSGSKEK